MPAPMAGEEKPNATRQEEEKIEKGVVNAGAAGQSATERYAQRESGADLRRGQTPRKKTQRTGKDENHAPGHECDQGESHNRATQRNPKNQVATAAGRREHSRRAERAGEDPKRTAKSRGQGGRGYGEGGTPRGNAYDKGSGKAGGEIGAQKCPEVRRTKQRAAARRRRTQRRTEPQTPARNKTRTQRHGARVTKGAAGGERKAKESGRQSEAAAPTRH